MNKGLEIRYIPAWLTGVVRYYNAGWDDFARIVSKHDLNLYHLANYLYFVKLQTLLVGQDFSFPDSKAIESITEQDSVFALFGPNAGDKKVAEFDPSRFEIFADKHEGAIIIVDNPTIAPKNLYEELTKAIAMYQGRDIALRSASFKQYLGSVNKNRLVAVA